jgi:hypothetical protein
MYVAIAWPILPRGNQDGTLPSQIVALYDL